MSRFRDLWVSGKFAIDRKTKDEVEARAEKEASQVIRELIPEPSQQMLTDLKHRRGQETGRWLKSLAGDVTQEAESAAWVQAQASAANSFDEAKVWIDALFQQFAELTYGFNENAVGTDLFVSIERPTVFETRDDDVWYHPVYRTYQGRLTTRTWSLITRGNEKAISIFVIPAEMTIGFKSGVLTEADMPPLLVAEHKTVGGKNIWAIQGEEAPLTAIGALAKELFGDLIRMTSGKMSESELFNPKAGKPELGKNVAVGYDQATQPKPPAESEAVRGVDVTNMSLHDACDVMDKVVDRELKRIYQNASKAAPGSPQAEIARKQISSIENFRMKVVDAFENYTQQSHAVETGETALAGKS